MSRFVTVQRTLVLLLLTASIAAELQRAAYGQPNAPEAKATATTVAPAADTGDHADKVALIKELLNVSRTLHNAQIGFQTVVEQQMRGYHFAINDRIDKNPNLSAQQKLEAKRVALAGFNKRMARVRELFAQKFDLNSVIADNYIKLYDKHYSVQEIKDMLAFYKSATGQKMLDVLPQLTQEMTANVNQALIPKLREVDAQLVEDEKSGKFSQ